jgi:thioredoxin domain-containing protein 5
MKIIELKNPTFNKNNIQQLLEKKICLVGVFSKLCIHCNNMKPQWNMLKKRLKKSNCNGLLLEIDSDQVNNIDYDSLTNSVKGLPTIMIFKNGKLLREYSGDRTSNDMFKFFKPYLVFVNNKTRKRKSKKNKTRRRKP